MLYRGLDIFLQTLLIIDLPYITDPPRFPASIFMFMPYPKHWRGKSDQVKNNFLK